MPFINVKLAGNLNRDQKAQIAKEFTDTIVRVTGKDASTVLFLIEGLERENWAKSGELLG